jgi:hypothetical protein
MTSPEAAGSRPSRRVRPRLIVPVDGTAASSADLVRGLRDAARDEGTVLACAIVDPKADDVERALVRAALEEQVDRAVEQTGIRRHSETALIGPVVFEALCGPARGGALVVVQESRRIVLRPAPLRGHVRPVVRPA